MKYSLLAVSALYPLASLAAPAGTSPNPLYKRAEIDAEAIKTEIYDHTKDTYQFAWHKKCSSDQVERLKQAVAEAGYLSNALRQWKPKGAYQNSLDFYMGTGSAGDQQKQIRDAVDKNWGLHTNDVKVSSSINVYCDEAVFQDGRKRCVGSTGAYSWSEELDNGMWRHGVVLCPRFFNNDETPTLADKIKATRADRSKAYSMAALYHTTGQDWLHETFHFEQTVTVPRAIDNDPEGSSQKIYGPLAISEAAKGKGAKLTAMLADGYSMAAVSNMQMQTFGISRPPSPYKYGFALDYLDPITESPALIDEADALPNPDDFEASASSWTRTSASEANINPSDYLPMPNEYPLCNPGQSKCNYISSCGDRSYWMPIKDFTGPDQSFPGYETVVNNFCKKTAGAIVAPKEYLTDVWNVGFDQGKDPAKNGKAGYLNIEIHNKFDDTHYVSETNCVNSLMAMAQEGQDCYGPNNVDTRGGTFQIGADKISYHALGSFRKHDELLIDSIVVGDTAQDDPDDDSAGMQFGGS